ncbi:hypothetical protein PENSPDRAFT_430354 [Peniophora sp. CONT]|nr:hypothetical protein PENSPDRAFT_430354 [Peniophora sp. CONT]
MLRQHIFMAGRTHVSTVERALAVLTETGIVYTALWVIYVAVVAVYFFSPNGTTDIQLDRGFQWTWMVMSMLIVRHSLVYSYHSSLHPLKQPLYPTSLILLIARHKTPLTETLTSIDVSTAVATSSSGSTADDVELHAMPDPDVKTGDDYYDPYAAGPNPRPSVRLEPNRRA